MSNTDNSGFLEANTGGANKFKKKNHYKLQDGDFVARIIPPMKEFTKNDRDWAVFHSVHFGYKNTTGKLRVFESPLVDTYDKDTKVRTVLVADPAIDRISDLESKLKKANEDGNMPLASKLNALVGFKGVYGLDKNWHMNVILLDGSIGELKIRNTAMADLRVEIKRLEAEGFRPISSDAGVFFVFHREGVNRNTTFKVSTYTVRVDLPGGGKANQEVLHNITPEIFARFKEEAFDLNNLFAKPTVAQVAQIVEESDLLSGKSPAIDRFIDEPWKVVRGLEANAKGRPDKEAPKAGDTKPSSKTETSAEQQKAQNTYSPQANATSRPLTGVTGSGSVGTGANTKSVSAASVTQGQSFDEMSDADFLLACGEGSV